MGELIKYQAHAVLRHGFRWVKAHGLEQIRYNSLGLLCSDDRLPILAETQLVLREWRETGAVRTHRAST